jgi:hypothetical protein
MDFEMRTDSQTLQTRRRRLFHAFGALLLGAAMLVGASAQAAEHRQPNGAAPGNSFAPAPGISIEKATAIARKHTGGRVLSATPKSRSNGTEYRVRMLVDGERVMTVVVDHKGRIKNKR